MFKRRKKQRNLADVDIDRDTGGLYLVREYEPTGVDRTVAIFVSKASAEHALDMIKKNTKLAKKNYYEIESFNYVEHKNSLVAK